eukprot:scaffold311956_cov21-Tisochrysis_lutea.AAC.1
MALRLATKLHCHAIKTLAKLTTPSMTSNIESKQGEACVKGCNWTGCLQEGETQAWMDGRPADPRLINC